jgi:multidrug efflux pump subunit AcrA (membrane-fusion protein)
VFDILYEGKNVSNVITYGVKVKPDQVPSFFRSQMTANISFISSHKDQALLIPASAVSEASGGGKQVMVPGPEGKPVPKAITTGLETGNKIEVLAGLAAGDMVVLSRGRYVPQQGVQSSPLMMGGRPGSSNSNSSTAPRPKRAQ